MSATIAPPSERTAAAVVARAGVGERVLDALLLAFAGWTLIYHVCVVAGLSTTAALALWAPLLSAAAVAAGRRPAGDHPDPEEPRVLHAPGWLRPAAVPVSLACALLFSQLTPRWGIVWLLWVGSAALGLAWLLSRRAPAPAAPAPDRLVTAAWMLALAVLALLTLNPDDDDAYYAHFSAWISAHGTFPTGDVMFGDEVFEAVYYPPVAAWEPLVGALSRLTGIPNADLLYLVVPPLAAALGVLALRRLLRSWAVPAPAAALTVALVFLLATSTENKTLGSFFIGRIWQGKVVLCVVLVPLLLALLYDYGRRPTAAAAARLGAAGIAGVGLSTTGIFLIPVIALGSMAALALRDRRAAIAGFAATATYPLAAGAVTLLLGGRNPEKYKDADAASGPLPHFALGYDALAFLAVAALLIAPTVILRPLAARMIAATVLLVGLVYAPRVPLAIFHLTDLGRVLWRLVWAIPVAALVGTLAVSMPRWRLAPAAALVAVLVVIGTPPWDDQSARGLRWPPPLKRFPEEVSAARTALAAARPGDTILAPTKISQTIGVLAGDVTTVNPRTFFVNALRHVPEARAAERRHLQRVADFGPPTPGLQAELERVGVDVVCLRLDRVNLIGALVSDGWRPATKSPLLTCFHPPAT